MDLLSHILSGVALSTVIVSFAKTSKKNKAAIIFFGALGGGFPDFDVLSHWRGFDRNFGKFFALDLPGFQIYHSHRWYAHHGFLHSLLGGALIASTLGIIIYLLRKKERTFIDSAIENRYIMLSFFLGFCAHLVEDMPTPAYAWGGVNFLFPSNEYWGGTVEIWWWNNYDMFLIILSVILLNTIVLIAHSYKKFNVKIICSSVLSLGLSLYLYQMKTLDFDFNYQKAEHSKVFKEYEQKSKDIQKEILGENMYEVMRSFDESLPIWF
ncbi:MAG: metal-dependent hydrolase [Flavobacteriales bacterium]